MKGEAPRPAAQEVRAPSLQLPRTGAAEHEDEAVFLDEAVHFVEDRRDLLYLIDEDRPLSNVDLPVLRGPHLRGVRTRRGPHPRVQ